MKEVSVQVVARYFNFKELNMKSNLLFLMALLVLLLSACSSSTVLKPASTSLRLIGDNVRVAVSGEKTPQKVLDQLTREIKGQLVIAGFGIDEHDSAKILDLSVKVTEFTPGNAALRMTIGLGAGRGSLLYLAEYKNQAGELLASKDGQERFTGLEVGFNTNYGAFTNMGGEETATTVLIKEAAKHIVDLAIKPAQQ
jgi:hypothetical protein